MPTTPQARRAYTLKISAKRQADLSRSRAERMEFEHWKKQFKLPGRIPGDRQNQRIRNYIRQFLRLDFYQLEYLSRAARKLLNGIPVAPYRPHPKKRAKMVFVEDPETGEDGTRQSDVAE